MAISRQRLTDFAGAFSPCAEVIAECGSPEVPNGQGRVAEDVLALLSRRPCTAEDVAQSLAMHITEATKCLEALKGTGRVRIVFLNAKWFYTVASSPGG